MTKEEKIQKRQYNKMLKKYTKQLRLIAKRAEPWDTAELLNYIETYLKFMKEYYTLGYNVFSLDEEIETTYNGDETKTRLESLTEALSEYNQYVNAYDPLANYQVSLNGREATDYSNEIKSQISQYFKQCQKDEAAHWEKFWKIFKDNALRWWD